MRRMSLADPDRPEVLVPDLVKFMKTHSRTGRVHPQVKGSGLDGLLFFIGQPGEAICKCVGNAKIHRITFVVW